MKSLFFSKVNAVGVPKPSRRTLVVRNVGWDPENLLGAPTTNLINRRNMARQRAADAELDQKMRKAAEKAKAELEEQRASRFVPSEPNLLIDFFLETEADEMDYEIARCRNLLDDEFFKTLATNISIEKMRPQADEDRLAELEGLQMYLVSGIKRVDEKTASMSAPAERLRKLLSAKDKKATILEMAGANEIDTDLTALLDINIEGAKAAGQPEQVIEFLAKIRTAITKYVIPAKRTPKPAAPAPAPEGPLSSETASTLLGATPAAAAPPPPAARAPPSMGSGSGLILPGASAPRPPGSGSGLIL